MRSWGCSEGLAWSWSLQSATFFNGRSFSLDTWCQMMAWGQTLDLWKVSVIGWLRLPVGKCSSSWGWPTFIGALCPCSVTSQPPCQLWWAKMWCSTGTKRPRWPLNSWSKPFAPLPSSLFHGKRETSSWIQMLQPSGLEGFCTKSRMARNGCWPTVPRS